MKLRDLKITANGREFNHLRVTNLDEFLLIYQNNIEFYKSPWDIIADLEKTIKFENNPEETILCSYKDDGDVLFDLEGITEEGDLRIVTYSFSTFAS